MRAFLMLAATAVLVPGLPLAQEFDERGVYEILSAPEGYVRVEQKGTTFFCQLRPAGHFALLLTDCLPVMTGQEFSLREGPGPGGEPGGLTDFGPGVEGQISALEAFLVNTAAFGERKLDDRILEFMNKVARSAGDPCVITNAEVSRDEGSFIAGVLLNEVFGIKVPPGPLAALAILPPSRQFLAIEDLRQRAASEADPAGYPARIDAIQEGFQALARRLQDSSKGLRDSAELVVDANGDVRIFRCQR